MKSTVKSVFINIILVTLIFVLPLSAFSKNKELQWGEPDEDFTNLVYKMLDEYPEGKSCMRDVSLKPTTEEESDQFSACLIVESVKLGDIICSGECLAMLSPEELEMYYSQRAERWKELTDYELERRTVEQIKASKLKG